MTRQRTRGFTLIELLTVIAIIAILAAIVFTALPQFLEKAKIQRMRGALQQVRTSLVDYYTTSFSYPPAYGFRGVDTRGANPAVVANALNNPSEIRGYYHLKPFMAYLKQQGNTELYDEFSEGFGYDTNLPPNGIGLLEFQPVGVKNVATGFVSIDDSQGERYNGSNLGFEVTRQLDETQRPFVYLPYNERQLRAAREYWISEEAPLADVWDTSNPLAAAITFPPSTYDNFILVGVGPGRSTFGILPEPLGTEAPEDLYHVTALRAVYLALRDLNANNQLDFHFEARKSGGEAEAEYNVSTTVRGVSVNFNTNNQLPDERAPNGWGPWIYVP